MTETQTVTDRAAADFLTSPETRFLLGPFMQRETTSSEAATALGGMGLNTLHRRVQQMLTLGLIEVTCEEVRRGHRVKLYRATSRAFVVPLEATTHVDLEGYLNGGFSGSAAILSRGVAGVLEQSTSHWGFRIYPAEAGGVYQQATALDGAFNPSSTGTSGQPCWYGDLSVRLSPEAARNFQLELQRLYERYLQRTDDDGEAYFFFAGLTSV